MRARRVDEINRIEKAFKTCDGDVVQLEQATGITWPTDDQWMQLLHPYRTTKRIKDIKLKNPKRSAEPNIVSLCLGVLRCEEAKEEERNQLFGK